MTSKYTKAVAEARRLIKRSEGDQWRLAELTWQQVQGGKSRRQWAKDIGVDPSAISRWFKIWERWGDDLDRPAWADAWDWALGRDEAVSEHGSQYQANARTALRNMPVAEKADLIADEIKNDPNIASAANRALDDRYAARPKPVPLPEPSAHDDRIDLVAEFMRLHSAVDRIVQLINEGRAVVTDDMRDAILREVKWLRMALGYIEDGVSSDSLSDEIASFLGAES